MRVCRTSAWYPFRSGGYNASNLTTVQTAIVLCRTTGSTGVLRYGGVSLTRCASIYGPPLIPGVRLCPRSALLRAHIWLSRVNLSQESFAESELKHVDGGVDKYACRKRTTNSTYTGALEAYNILGPVTRWRSPMPHGATDRGTPFLAL